MIGLLERAAAAEPDRIAVVTPEGAATYPALLDDARRVAGTLVDRRTTSAVLVEPDVSWVIRVLAGAALVGVDICQFQADIDGSAFAVQSEALGYFPVLTRRPDLARAVDTIPTSALRDGTPVTDRRSGPQPVTIRTTGTTGTPKAARHDWSVLARTVAAVEPRPHQRWLMAYGPHQFAGIQVLQHVIASHATLIAPFPRQPADGLAALLEHEVTCVSATPTYWRFLLAEARSRGVALPPLEQVTLGGEAAPAELLASLRSAFPAARISHIYASTEFGSVASVADGRPGLPVSSLARDENPTANLRIVDGELQVRAAAGMLGYVGSAAPDDAEPSWRPTGDLVTVVGDRVVFTGRTSEVINVGGVKVHPLPIEERIGALPRVEMARVFGRSNRLTGAIVAAEVVPVPGLDDGGLDDLRHEIRSAVADLPRAWHPRSVNFVNSIATRGAKTVRRMEP
ncbi:acyl--CoA ligase [Paraconexibacter antarcticus]|uniref:Acyl--CoA ligase n=1 Tax=Paraconexibacter antarcticus TaxID=2949664 RepID=A0ABY5DP68_9ACTN|nr:class I adenylate-forming enzyme family protein [Paraconexibacter antarcticus]UTI62607.1 acyl--CoA ligase [Paraconexibacter antarcticus]